MGTDARHVPLTRVDRLRQDAAEAAAVRALTTHPDVVALQVERVRAWVSRLMWAGITLGLAYTMVNVQQFAAAGAPPWSAPWLVAWLLDPMVSLVLVAILLAEQVTARWQVPMLVNYAGPWVRTTKWITFSATYAMNTWTSWAHVDPAGIVLHSVPPVLVICAAEAGPIVRDRLTEAVRAAAADAGPAGPPPAAATAPEAPATAPSGVLVPLPVNGSVNAPVNGFVNGHRPVHKAPSVNAVNGGGGRDKRGRRKLGDFVNDALAEWTPATVVTPAWVRDVTNCSRGISPKVAAEVKARLNGTGAYQPEQSTGGVLTQPDGGATQ